MTPGTCTACGTPSEADARFCGGCGIRLAPGGEAAPSRSTQRLERAGFDTLADEPIPTPARPRTDERGLDWLVGHTLNDRYLVDRKIGEGGFGAVFQATQVGTGRPVALKVLHPHNVSDNTVVARFRREAEACSRLRSPHTVTIYDFDETSDAVIYLAMELVRGESLQQLQKREGPLPPGRVLRILDQVADALGEAHEQKIVHRDMKPENVMIERRGEVDFVKVLDFGIAKVLGGGTGPALTAYGQTVGTLEFMSPEQLRGRTLDGRSDLYAIGIMAYEMLTGTLPFRGAKSQTDVIQFHLQSIPPPPSRLAPGLKIPHLVNQLVVKMVAKEVDDRHAHAGALRRDIHRVLGALEDSGAPQSLRKLALAGGIALALAGIVALFAR